jgi:exopolysaccharide production protein ExoQ
MFMDSVPPGHAGFRARLAAAPAIFWISVLLAGLPLLAGLMFRTYWYHTEPQWYENLRQFDFPFYPAELAVIFIAHARGMRFREFYSLLDKPARAAIVLFLATFWLGSGFISEHPLYSLLRCFYSLTHIGFGCAVFYLVKGRLGRNVKMLTAALSIGLLLYVPMLTLHYSLAPDPADVRGGQIIWSSALPGFLSVRHLGIHAGAILALTAALALIRPEGPGRNWIYGAVLLSATLLFWSGTRAGILGIGGAAIIAAMMLRRLPPAKPAILVALCLLAAVPLSMIWLPPEPVFGIVRITATESLQAAEEGVAGFSAGRFPLWKQHWPLFLSSPWLGHGEGATFWLTELLGTQHIQPHNSIIQFVIGWGLIATLAMAYLAFRGWLLLHRAAMRQSAAIPLVAMIDCLLAMSLLDGVLYFTRMTMLVAAGAAIVLACRRDAADPALKPSPFPQAPSALDR